MRHLVRPTTAKALLCVVLALAGLAGCSTAANRQQPSTLSQAQIAGIVASPGRSDADKANDTRRKPAELLALIGVRPGMTVLDISAGGGYTSELLARAVGPNGRVYGQSPPPRPDASGQTPARSRSATLLADRAGKAGLPHLVAVMQPFTSPAPADLAPQSLDLATLMFNYHDLAAVDRGAMNRAVFAALAPGGSYVIADHAGRPGTGISESNTLHRVEEDFVVREVQAAGFQLAARGDFLRNPNDPRDRETPEPLQPKDEFVLKFVKSRP